jgi:hypothetical protein
MVGNPMTDNQSTGSKGETIAKPPQTIGGNGVASTTGNNRVYTRDLNAKFLDRFTKNTNETSSNKVSSSNKTQKAAASSASNKKSNSASKALNV